MADDRRENRAPSMKSPPVTVLQQKNEFLASRGSALTGYVTQAEAQAVAAQYAKLVGGAWAAKPALGRWDVVRVA